MKQTAELTGSARFIELEERHGAHNYHPLDVVIARAEGAWVWDVAQDVRRAPATDEDIATHCKFQNLFASKAR